MSGIRFLWIFIGAYVSVAAVFAAHISCGELRTLEIDYPKWHEFDFLLGPMAYVIIGARCKFHSRPYFISALAVSAAIIVLSMWYSRSLIEVIPTGRELTKDEWAEICRINGCRLVESVSLSSWKRAILINPNGEKMQTEQLKEFLFERERLIDGARMKE